MRQCIKNKYTLLIVAAAFGFNVSAQTSICPPNIDFETGTLASWQCRTGKVESISGVNTVTWLGSGQVNDNHRIFSRVTAGNDTYGGFSQVCPNGSGYSVRLGNNFFSPISAEGMSYTFTIPDTATVFSILFHYAVVFQDPEHNPDEQPRFRANVFNVTDNEIVDCSNFDFTASALLPGFQVSQVDTTVIYKDWTPVTLNLSGYAGKTIRLEFITSDCTFTGHFGYAYIDVSSSCSGAVSGNIICPEASNVSLTAPFGFQTYAWYPGSDFSTTLSNSQILHLNPPPATGTSYQVVVGPYPGFGCPDTISVRLEPATKPEANAGADVEVCATGYAQLGAIGVIENTYQWSPANWLSNAAIATPSTLPGLPGPTNFYLTVTNKTTGCKNYDTTLVEPITIDTSLIVMGDTVFCNDETITTVLRAMNTIGSIQWYQNGVAINGATANQFTPSPATSSVYHAAITRGMCSGFTRTVAIKKLPVPVPLFSIDPAEQCMNGPVQLTNRSTLVNGVINNYQWKLSDGRNFSTKDVALSFNRPGEYTILLKAISDDGCADSSSQNIRIVEKCDVYVPTGFTPGDDGINDIFKPVFYGVSKLRRFSVYDRSGVMVFHTTKAGEGWDGKINGKKVPSSIFVWMLEYETADGKAVLLKGVVTLIR